MRLNPNFKTHFEDAAIVHVQVLVHSVDVIIPTSMRFNTIHEIPPLIKLLDKKFDYLLLFFSFSLSLALFVTRIKSDIFRIVVSTRIESNRFELSIYLYASLEKRDETNE